MTPEQEIAALERILGLIIDAVEDIESSGEELDDDLAGAVAEEITFAMQRIQELQASPISGPQTPGPPVEPTNSPSSNINAMIYDPENQDAYIKFQDKYPGQNGPTYKYSGVPQYIFDVIQRGSVAPKTSGKNRWHRWEKGVTPSHGASVNALLKAGGFNYQRLT
jgi:hypothetical protein